jgi:hypothetical protein
MERRGDVEGVHRVASVLEVAGVERGRISCMCHLPDVLCTGLGEEIILAPSTSLEDRMERPCHIDRPSIPCAVLA